MKFKLLKKLVFSTIFMFGSIAFAQTVSGVVTEASGPLGGVNILEKGTSNGVLTDFDGNYSIDATTESPVLVFSYIGYLTQEVAVAGQTNLNIALAEDAAVLGVEDDDLLSITSRRGSIKVKAWVSKRPAKGLVFVPFHFHEIAVNRLTNAALDPVAKIPEFKVCAVKVERAV
jgi:formylmethanofuran dehydrogenase subunit D